MFNLFVTAYLLFPSIETLEAKDILKRDINSHIDGLLSAKHVDREIIVKFKEGVAYDEVVMVKASAIAHSKTGAIVKRKFKRMKGLHLVRLPEFKTVRQALKSYLKNPDIEYAEPNYIVRINAFPDDFNFNNLWGLHNDGQTGGTVDADIDAPEAWDIFTGSSNVIVAVIDTGVDYAHEDLFDNMWTNTAEIINNGIDDDSNGYIDDDKGWDFSTCAEFNPDDTCKVPKPEDNDPYDDHWHGTHCSGIIGAVGDNGTGVVGVNWGIQIMPLKAFNSYGEGSIIDIIDAILYAVDNGADILSNSWGGGGYSSALEDVIVYVNDNDVLFVAAAGNDGSNNDVNPFYPASYDVPNVIAVAAIDHNDNKPSWSNYGAASVDLGAPGVSVFSTRPGDRYFSKSGTSMATPYVSGVAGLIKAWNPDLTNIEIIDAILNNVDVISSLTGKVLTGGRLNAYKALSSVNCTNLPVMNMRTGTEFQTLQEAYNAAVSGDNIRSQAGIVTEDLIFDLNKSVFIDGGYDCNYTDNIGSKTTLLGTMSINDGVVTMGNFILE
jgi:subtilisin family serine protease